VEARRFFWIMLKPQLGHEQKGRRPALIVSNKENFMGTVLGFLALFTFYITVGLIISKLAFFICSKIISSFRSR